MQKEVTADAPIWNLVLSDMRERKAMGEHRHGNVFRRDTGPDALRAAYEEVLDLTVYLRQEIEREEPLRQEIERLTGILHQISNVELGRDAVSGTEAFHLCRNLAAQGLTANHD